MRNTAILAVVRAVVCDVMDAAIRGDVSRDLSLTPNTGPCSVNHTVPPWPRVRYLTRGSVCPMLRSNASGNVMDGPATSGMDSNRQAIVGFVIKFSPTPTQRRRAANHLMSGQIIK